jgi:hypothetical protein
MQQHARSHDLISTHLQVTDGIHQVAGNDQGSRKQNQVYDMLAFK